MAWKAAARKAAAVKEEEEDCRPFSRPSGTGSLEEKMELNARQLAAGLFPCEGIKSFPFSACGGDEMK